MKILVYLGTGGVGKTSVAAATALAMARAGERTLVLTIDPALRLRSALRLQEGLLEQQVPLDPPASGELWAALLDVRATLDDAVRMYAKAGMVDRILNHPIYATIADSLVGMQELMAVERIDQLAKRGFDSLVIDTAPSRHALEFLDKPMYFSELVGSNWVKLVGRTYKWMATSPMASLSEKVLDVYARVEAILGTDLVRQVLDFYSIFVSIAEGYAERAVKTVALLKDPAITEFRIVTTPRKAMRDTRFFLDALESRQFRTGGVFVNRTWELDGAAAGEGLVGSLAEWYAAVRQSHAAELDSLRGEFDARVPFIATLPELDSDVDGLPALERIGAWVAARAVT
ncbi:MAG: ArsA family ATPase [Bryobacterales bacterium]|nr:ArsA family ATPase [Bryobacterales bacterium]